MSATRVLLVTPRWARDGGVGTHVVASATALAAHGLEVKVLAARVDSTVSAPGVTTACAPQLFDRELPPEVRLGRSAHSNTPTVIHLHQFDDPAIVNHLQMSAAVLASVHGYTACTSGVHYFRPGQECTREHGIGCVPNVLLRGCAHTRHLRSAPDAYRQAGRAREGLRCADLVLSYSSSVDRHLETNGVVRREVIPLFSTMVPSTATGHAARRRVVFAGRIVAAKGVGVLIRAARSVDAEFVICGDGVGLGAMRRLAGRLGVEERVRFRGWLDAAGLARELAEASVVAMPSVWPEPFGLVGIEALSAGRPVIASSTGGIVDWLQDGVNGIAVAPGDERELASSLQALLADPARQAAMGSAGKQMVAERYSAQHHVNALAAAYRHARARWESSGRGGASERVPSSASTGRVPQEQAPLGLAEVSP